MGMQAFFFIAWLGVPKKIKYYDFHVVYSIPFALIEKPSYLSIELFAYIVHDLLAIPYINICIRMVHIYIF